VRNIPKLAGARETSALLLNPMLLDRFRQALATLIGAGPNDPLERDEFFLRVNPLLRIARFRSWWWWMRRYGISRPLSSTVYSKEGRPGSGGDRRLVPPILAERLWPGAAEMGGHRIRSTWAAPPGTVLWFSGMHSPARLPTPPCQTADGHERLFESAWNPGLTSLPSSSGRALTITECRCLKPCQGQGRHQPRSAPSHLSRKSFL